MTRKKVETNLQAYDKVVQSLVCDFMRKWLDEDEYKEFCYKSDIHWIGDDVGGTFDYADYCINFSDTVLDLLYDMPKGAFDKWYHETVERGCNEEQTINYWSYCKGMRYEELDNLVLFREHRGSLADSLATQRNIRTLNDVFNIANVGLFYDRLSDLTCEWYGNEERMKEWNETYIITAMCNNDMFGSQRIVLGFSNKPLK